MDSDSNTDSFHSAMSSPRSVSSSPFTPFTPLTPAGSPAFEVIGSPITPSCNGNRNGGYQGMPWEFPLRGKEVQVQVQSSSERDGDGDSVEEIKRRRDVFLASNKDIIIPLLPEGHFDCTRAQGQIKPYKLVHQPLGLRATLKPYQLTGLSFLLYLKNNGMNGILGDEMGLGKTLQTLALFQYLKESTTLNVPYLVVCPLSVIDGWVSEAAKWTPGLEVLKYHGSQAERVKIKAALARRRKAATETVPDIVVTGYDTVMSDIVWFRRAFVWKYIVLDEGHRIKNDESKKTQILDRVLAEYKLVLTGTPVQNDLRELWSIFHWLYPDVFDKSTVGPFDEAFSLSDGKFDAEFLSHCKRFLGLIMLRRTKESPGIGLDIPLKRDINLSVPLSDLQHAWYLKILTGGGIDVLDDQSSFGSSPGDGFEYFGQKADVQKKRISMNILMELRKCSIHPYLLDDAHNDSPGAHTVLDSGKFVILQKIIQQVVIEEHKKIIIFSNFDHALTLCEDLLTTFKNDGHHFSHARLDGRTSSAWRRLFVHLFTHDPRYKIFLVSIRAGGEGLNLTSSSTVVFLDEDWNPQVMRQAEARVHRIGQTQPVSIFKLYSRGTVEEQMHRRLAKKAYLAAMVTDASGSAFDVYGRLVQSDNGLLASFAGEGIKAREIGTDELSSWDLETILEKCRPRDGGVQKIADRDEKAWLQRAESIQTNLFNGSTIDTANRGFSIYKENADLARPSRRIGKTRIVMVEGYEVTKENLALSPLPEDTMESDPSESGSGSESDTPDTICFLCKCPKANECRLCPRAFHQRCLQRICPSYDTNNSMFLCPHHYCFTCKKAASQVGRLLFCCQSCVKAYCEKCLDWEKTVFVGNEGCSSTAFPVKCAFCVSHGHKRGMRGERRMVKRVKF